MIDACCAEFNINNERRVAAFLANLAHESKNLTKWEENLNYSAKRLTEVWPNRFPTLQAAEPYAHNPEGLANKTYGGRMGNTTIGDGWKYRGRFPIQITGKSLYRKAATALDLPLLLDNPDSLMSNPMVGFRVSAWVFAVEKGCNQLADKQQLKAITLAINGGLNGLQERIDLYNRAMRALPDGFIISPNAKLPSEEEDSTPDFLVEAETEEDHGDVSPVSVPEVTDEKIVEPAPPKVDNPAPVDITLTPTIPDDRTSKKSFWTMILAVPGLILTWITANVEKVMGWMTGADVNNILKWVLICGTVLVGIFLLRQTVKMVITQWGNILYNRDSMRYHADPVSNNVKLASPAPADKF
jgi:putative chitinase